MDLQRAVMMATDCMKYYGLFDRYPSWTFKLTRSMHNLGSILPSKHVLNLSKPYATNNSEDEVLDTILHEIAHALTVEEIADRGTREWHGPIWKRCAREIGATPETCNRSKSVVLPTKWKGTCSDCGVSAFRTRQPKPITLLASFHPQCRHKKSGGKILWYFEGKPIGTGVKVLPSTIDSTQPSV